jgi:uncharacterized protein (DUF1330 family)
MAFEMLVGLEVTDSKSYQAYREAMTPVLVSYGGSFTNDFQVSQALKTAAGHTVNRVFTIRFPDQESKERFFADKRYLEIKKRFFEKAVAGTTILAAYTV